MLKYLDYVLSEISQVDNKYIADIFTQEVILYKKYWQKYATDHSQSPLYNSTPEHFNRHCFHLPTNETISISWDVDFLHGLATQAPIHNASLATFENLISNDLISSADEIRRVSCKVNSIHSHKFAPLLVMYFNPTHSTLLVDGRHRYIEYKKFKPSDQIPIVILDDSMCFTSIPYKNDLLAYILLHNTRVIGDYLNGCSPLGKILNLKKCMKC